MRTNIQLDISSINDIHHTIDKIIFIADPSENYIFNSYPPFFILNEIHYQKILYKVQYFYRKYLLTYRNKGIAPTLNLIPSS
ncbi:hypothetical protein KM029_10625 [Flammeovirga kamogawensis]|uniref:Uncharacterized protein n=1 Tax=Flammeovirga kamogawensis TaxID=373891 RepID=A0ABX8GQH8_9BACT|nr:hypothetical protein [Flammeovirga kamogawensis]MBB6462099.1 hypothetical protein [Flammeovirga kamogawensis]QWG05833.1 hypothetical protein KM029_10625 [Flammeovirga kamogawensis]